VGERRGKGVGERRGKGVGERRGKVAGSVADGVTGAQTSSHVERRGADKHSRMPEYVSVSINSRLRASRQTTQAPWHSALSSPIS